MTHLPLVSIAIVLAGALTAQQASSPTYLLAAAELASSGAAQSAQHRLVATSSDAVGPRSQAAGYVLLGGHLAGLDVATTGRPWLVGVRPRYAPLLGGTTLTLHGTELHLPSVSAVEIAGIGAVIGARTRDAISITLPPLSEPGWQSVAARFGIGDRSVLGAGLGVLPLLEFERAPGHLAAGTVVFRGSLGDFLVLGLGAPPLPTPITVAGLHFGLLLNPANLVISGTVPIVRADGTFRLEVPPLSAAYAIWLQGFALSTAPGYAPGSFTNVLQLF